MSAGPVSSKPPSLFEDEEVTVVRRTPLPAVLEQSGETRTPVPSANDDEWTEQEWRSFLGNYVAPEIEYKTASASRRQLLAKLVVEEHRYKVRNLAYSFTRALPRDMDDLIQAGLEGLCIALHEFDPARGVPFWGFARYEVRTQIKKCLEKRSLFEKPLNRSVSRKARLEHSGEKPIRGERRPAHLELSEDLSSSNNPEEAVGDREAMAHLYEFIGQLSDEDRNLLLRAERTLEGARPNPSWKTRRHRALVKMAREYVRAGESDLVPSDVDRAGVATLKSDNNEHLLRRDHKDVPTE